MSLTEATSIAEIAEQMGICMNESDPLQTWEEVIWTAYQYWFSWKIRIEATKIRDEKKNKRCEKCGSTTKVVMHHIVPVIIGGNNAEDNIAYLCSECHRDVHKCKAYEKEMFDKWLGVRLEE